MRAACSEGPFETLGNDLSSLERCAALAMCRLDLLYYDYAQQRLYQEDTRMILAMVESRENSARSTFCENDGCVGSSRSGSEVTGDDNLESEPLLPKLPSTVTPELQNLTCNQIVIESHWMSL